MTKNLKSGSHRFADQYGTAICKFFYRMQMKQLRKELLETKGKDGSIVFAGHQENWEYSDHRQGGQPFSGTITIWMDGVICFTMHYRGRVQPYVKDKERLDECLREALEHMHWRTPWRGPEKYLASNGLLYGNELTTQSIRDFSGVERIVDLDDNDNLLYELYYMGGIVNKD